MCVANANIILKLSLIGKGVIIKNSNTTNLNFFPLIHFGQIWLHRFKNINFVVAIPYRRTDGKRIGTDPRLYYDLCSF